ncbi:hypothetical protein ABW19_dt0207460 [Dactylella cylindrospora]|nr:hypothetical protein ABW19_dt0207460 [Dactylella cylindrospora]
MQKCSKDAKMLLRTRCRCRSSGRVREKHGRLKRVNYEDLSEYYFLVDICRTNIPRIEGGGGETFEEGRSAVGKRELGRRSSNRVVVAACGCGVFTCAGMQR